MLLSGFTFIRNAIKYDFPITECVESMLPLLDELVINVGKSEDGTEELIAALKSPKIRIINSVWDESKTDRGLVLSEQTNIALEACRGRWCLYLQADEAIHEAEHAAIRRAIEEEDQAAQQTEGLRLRYLHFYGGYTLLQRPWNWYPSEIRVIRRDTGARSYGDAQTFRISDGGQDRELKTRLIDAHVFHYGHARAPEIMKEKIHYFHRFWHGDRHGIKVQKAYELDWKKLVWYWGSHPAPYLARITKGRSWSPRPSQAMPQATSVVIFAGRAEQKLAQDLKTLIETAHPGCKCMIAEDLLTLLSAPRHSVLVDLLAEKRGALTSALWAPLAFSRFPERIAHAPTGRLSGFQERLYTFISWGRHERAELGFRVPATEQTRQLGYWLGIET